MNDRNYTPREIAAETGLSVQTVRKYLADRFPAHYYESWWRLSLEEYEIALGELRTAREVMFHQPRRALRRKQLLMPLF